jgi:hypothetical protein
MIETHQDPPTKRHGHSFTAVSDTIILFGGYGSGGRLNDVWKLDPVTLSWEYMDIQGNRPFRRSHHSAVALSHKVVIFGGLSATACQDLWELNTLIMRWNRLELSKNPKKVDLGSNLVGPSPRYGHTSCLFRGLRMFMFGGVANGNFYREDLWYLYIDPSLEAPVDFGMQFLSQQL